MQPVHLLQTVLTLAIVVCAASIAAKQPPPAPAGSAVGNPHKVLVCHKNRHTIHIAGSALPAHEAHGDWEVDDYHPCPAEEDTGWIACVVHPGHNPVTRNDIDRVRVLQAPEFNLHTGLVYLPQVRIDILGLTLAFAVILQRVSDTDFLVRYVKRLKAPFDEDVAYVEFDGTSTVVPFDIAVVPPRKGIQDITDVEFTVLEGCDPVQLSVTNFVLVHSHSP